MGRVAGASDALTQSKKPERATYDVEQTRAPEHATFQCREHLSKLRDETHWPMCGARSGLLRKRAQFDNWGRALDDINLATPNADRESLARELNCFVSDERGIAPSPEDIADLVSRLEVLNELLARVRHRTVLWKAVAESISQAPAL